MPLHDETVRKLNGVLKRRGGVQNKFKGFCSILFCILLEDRLIVVLDKFVNS